MYSRGKSKTEALNDWVMDMWLFTTGGFLSAVEHREDKDKLMVRARDKRSLETMIEGIELAGSAAGKDLTGLKIIQKTPSDYPWRVEVSKATFAMFAVHEIMNYLNYSNFKNAVTEIRGPKWHQAAMNVWVDMLAVADGDDGSGTNYPKGSAHGAYGSTYGGYSAWTDRELDDNLEKSYDDILSEYPADWVDVDEVAAAGEDLPEQKLMSMTEAEWMEYARQEEEKEQELAAADHEDLAKGKGSEDISR